MYPVRDPKLKTLVIRCVIQRFNEKESLAYLRTEGYDITERTLFRVKKNLKQNQFSRLSDIAKSGFVAQHLERIDQLELISKEIWTNYYKEDDPSKKVIILATLAQIQPYLSQYYEASKELMEKNIRDEIRYQDRSESNSISKDQHQ